MQLVVLGKQDRPGVTFGNFGGEWNSSSSVTVRGMSTARPGTCYDPSTRQPAPNCSDNQRPFKALMAPAPHPTQGPQLLTQLYMVPHQTDAEPTGALCTPFVSDGCGTHLPFHIVHFTGRFKHYMGMGFGFAKRMQQRCTCIRSWKNEWLEGTPGGAVLFSHAKQPIKQNN